MDETRELFESHEVSQLLSSCTKAGLTCVLDKLADSLAALADSSQSPGFVHPNQQAIYLAKLIPVLNNFIFQDVLITQLLSLAPLRTFGANVYESFST